MQSTAWQELLGRFPQKQHNNLVVATTVGIDITVQELVRMESDYLVIRGRLAGTSDAGRLFVIPYGHISHLGLAKVVQDHEIEEIFGTPAPAVTGEVDVPADPDQAGQTADSTSGNAESDPEPAAEPLVDAPSSPPTPTKFPNRAELLERIRSRSQPITPRPQSK